MTEQEFKQLKNGCYVKTKRGEVYKIIQEDVWGPPTRVFLAQFCGEEFGQAQISESNRQFWERIYPYS